MLRKGTPSSSSGILSEGKTRKPVMQIMSEPPDANTQRLLNDFLRIDDIERQAHQSQDLESPITRSSPESPGKPKRRRLHFASLLPAEGNSVLGEVS